MRAVLTGILLLGCAAGLARGQQTMPEAPPSSETLDTPVQEIHVFSLQSKAPGQPSWEFTVGPDRTGSFRRLGPDAAAKQTLTVGEPTWKRLVSGDRTVRSGHCETREKHIAQTGSKTMSLVTGASTATCTFNYSDDEHLNDAALAFEAMQSTLEFGDQLSEKHRFDKLALDAEIDSFTEEVKAGRAIEVQNVAPVLRSIVEDDRVIDRVRRKAARLLQDAGVDVPALPDKPR